MGNVLNRQYIGWTAVFASRNLREVLLCMLDRGKKFVDYIHSSFELLRQRSEWAHMAVEATKKSEALLRVEELAGEEVVFHLEGRLDSQTVGTLWHKGRGRLHKSHPRRLVVQAEGVTYCDGCGIGLLFEFQLVGNTGGYEVEIRGLADEFTRLLDMFDVAEFVERHEKTHRQVDVAEEVGRTTVEHWRDFRLQVSFLGEVWADLAGVILHPWKVRWRDMFLIAERAGANAVGIIALVGFLFGLIMAFSSAMPLRQFGVEVYVSDLAALALVRVLGPFITAIILAGRSGSAFAAEIGTMKINYELDALETMGLNPIRFLVVPRVIATTLVMPLLAIIANLAGIIGAGFVIVSLGFPLITYTTHVKSAIDSGDIFSGLVKAVVFGWLIGWVGCLRGFQTETGASAVGISATRAVVSGIVLIIITEGVFSVLYHFMGI